MQSVFTVGIAGGSGAGKSTLVRAVAQAWPGACLILCQDWYYRDCAGLSPDERLARNFDAPDAVESELFAEHLQRLRRGEAVSAPQYDFRHHVRRKETLLLTPAALLCVEGLHVLAFPAVRQQLDLAVYLDCPADIRLGRRVARDLGERNRSPSSVRRQFIESVEPMHLRHVAPSRSAADLVLDGGLAMARLVTEVLARIHGMRGTNERAKG